MDNKEKCKQIENLISEKIRECNNKEIIKFYNQYVKVLRLAVAGNKQAQQFIISSTNWIIEERLKR